MGVVGFWAMALLTKVQATAQVIFNGSLFDNIDPEVTGIASHPVAVELFE